VNFLPGSKATLAAFANSVPSRIESKWNGMRNTPRFGQKLQLCKDAPTRKRVLGRRDAQTEGLNRCDSLCLAQVPERRLLLQQMQPFCVATNAADTSASAANNAFAAGIARRRLLCHGWCGCCSGGGLPLSKESRVLQFLLQSLLMSFHHLQNRLHSYKGPLGELMVAFGRIMQSIVR